VLLSSSVIQSIISLTEHNIQSEEKSRRRCMAQLTASDMSLSTGTPSRLARSAR